MTVCTPMGSNCVFARGSIRTRPCPLWICRVSPILSYDRFLLALTEQEVAQRKRNRQLALIHAARFPVLKELADFDFMCLPGVNKQQVLALAGGRYIQKVEPLVMVGNRGLGKTHMAIGLALAPAARATKFASIPPRAWSTS